MGLWSEKVEDCYSVPGYMNGHNLQFREPSPVLNSEHLFYFTYTCTVLTTGLKIPTRSTRTPRTPMSLSARLHAASIVQSAVLT